tara:strand:- start:1847 stop:2488 length:642 start_codon:yes stop_codon:yes gene_type:complete
MDDLEQMFSVDMPPDKEPLPPAGEATGIGTKPVTMRTQARRRLFYNLKDVSNAEEHLGELPKPDETVHLLMPGNFASFDLVIAIANRFPAQVERVTISTLGFNKRNFNHLCRMTDEGVLGGFSLLASELFREKDHECAEAAILEARENPKVRIAFTRNHAKIQVFEGGGHYIVSETSANLRSCNCVEQATITNNKALADFHRTWIEEVIDRHE